MVDIYTILELTPQRPKTLIGEDKTLIFETALVHEIISFSYFCDVQGKFIYCDIDFYQVYLGG